MSLQVETRAKVDIRPNLTRLVGPNCINGPYPLGNELATLTPSYVISIYRYTIQCYVHIQFTIQSLQYPLRFNMVLEPYNL